MSLNSVRRILLIRKRTLMPPLGNKARASNATPVTAAETAFSAKKHVTKGVNARLAATSGVLALLLAGVTPVAAAHAADAPDNASAITATTDNAAENSATAAPAADHMVLEKGHVDAFNVTASNGALKLNLKEDVTGSHVPRDPSKVELHVKDAAKQTIPDGWPGAGQSYFLPQTQNHDLLWPGWDTLGTQGGGVEKHIDLEFTAVSGPGKVYLFGTNGFGQMEPLLKNGATELKAGAVREQTFPAHTHANWAFTKPGLYKITVKARGTASKSGAAVESEEQTYYFTVGSAHKGTAFKKAEPKPQPAPEKPAPQPEKPAPEKPKPAPQPEKPAPEKPAPAPEKPKPAPEKKKPAPKKPAPAPAPEKQKPESQKPAAQKPAEKPATEKPEAVAPSKPVAEGATGPAVTAPQAPATPGAAQCMPVEEVREATQQEIDAANSGGRQGKTSATTGSVTKGGTSALGASGLLPMSQVNGSATVPANSHVHPNWVFSKPGTYTVQIRQSATLKSGGTTSARATLRFNVGPGATGATNGHFDLGSQLNGKTLKASLKDDRKQPAAWVEPSSITFALGDAARVAAPAGIEFVAPKGSNVWMVPSTQIPGVPWIGANTMHPSLKDTTGPVTWTLESVSGPGNVAVFTSGNFGQIVGQRWFNSTASAATPGKQPGTQPGNGSSTPGAASGTEGSKPTVTVSGIAKDQKSAKKGQLFKKGGKVMVVDTVGRTADGKPCALPQAGGGSLARTGADVAHAGVVGGLLAAVGAGAFMLRRRARNAE